MREKKHKTKYRKKDLKKVYKKISGKIDYRKITVVWGICLLFFGGLGCKEKEYIQKKYQIDTVTKTDGLDEETSQYTEISEEMPKPKEEYGAAGENQGDSNTKSADVCENADNLETVENQTAKETLVVYICGAVHAPGVYELEDGSRVVDAIMAAGGLTKDADTIWMNQARRLADGERIQILTVEEARILKEQGSYTEDKKQLPVDGHVSSNSQSGKVNINTADITELMTLPGIGQVKAEAIVQYRSEYGAFASIKDLLNVSGIKESVFSKLKDMITI